MKTKDLRHATFEIHQDDISKKAGVNRLTITARNDDWRIGDSTISLSLRDAKSLRDFLNKEL